MSTFKKSYLEAYPNEPYIISREMYGRRKWKILRSMTKQQLIDDFKNNEYFGKEINQRMTKEQILTVLKKYSGFI